MAALRVLACRAAAREAKAMDQLREHVQKLRQHMPELEAAYDVKALGVFGSYVRGDQRKRSDLDLLVEFHQAPSLFKFIALEHYLSDLLGVRVDLVMKDALEPAIGQHILSDVVVV